MKIPAGETLSSNKVLTKARLALELTDGIGPVSGVNLTLRSDRSSLDVIDDPEGPTGADGRAEAFVSTRDQTSESTIDSTTPLVWTEPKGVVTWLPARYESTFKATCYLTSLESEFTDNFVDSHQFSWCTFIPTFRTYRRKFMDDVKGQGSGKSVQGEWIQYTGKPKNCFYFSYFSDCATTKTSECASVGVTAAVDPTVIPMGGTIDIDVLGSRRAQDIGALIGGPHIDIYNGVGKSACKPLPWPDVPYEVTFVSY